MSRWGYAVKGDVDHVELVFVNQANNSLIAYFITSPSVRAKYVERDFSNLKEKCDSEWFEFDITFEQEMVLRDFCRKRANDDITISLQLMMMSGLPSGLEVLARYLIGFVEHVNDINDRPSKIHHFCASLTAEALREIGICNNYDLFKSTANDLVLYLTDNKHIKSCKEVVVQNDFSKDGTMFFPRERSIYWRRKKNQKSTPGTHISV